MQRSSKRNDLTDEPASPAPLAGLRVLDVSTILAGPLCCQILGDFGADVIKVEHPSGDNMRGHGRSKDGVPLWWKEISRNKRTVSIDLKHEQGAEVLLRLAQTADVLVENFRPGTLERWGLGPDVLHRENPGLVVVRVTGFGQTGPYSSRAGFGTLAEAMSGFARCHGRGRRATYAARLRARRQHLRNRRVLGHDDGPAPSRCHRRRVRWWT